MLLMHHRRQVCANVGALLTVTFLSVCPPSAHRELQEESGLTVDTLQKVGQIMFEFVGEPELMDVHIFCTDSVQGTPMESDGEPGWAGEPGQSWGQPASLCLQGRHKETACVPTQDCLTNSSRSSV